MEASKRPPGQHPGDVLHQRRNLPFSPSAMAVSGFLIIATIGYFTLYSKSKPGTTPGDVTKATVGDALRWRWRST
ncbi:putative Transmembrane protein [Cocos nucifera]|uniref:Putative Transmembrane protein n=1 Tax=Cocos nucifera TaxID=13894 RepID=A0A8K0IPE6_COCNU|nr:putative Transmembrane protein [Cocos nucifera]